jgi:hypothetical protein
MSRTLRALVALVMLAVIVAGCSSTSGGTGGTSTATTRAGTSSSNNSTRGKAVRFAECMRSNGVSGFPDPDASGELTIDAVANGSSVDTSSAAFTQAMSVCMHLQPPGFTGHERNAHEQEGALAFAQCIRDNGVPDFPDPAKDEPMVDTRRIPSADLPGGMSILNAAMKKCGRYGPSAGVEANR